MILILRRFFGIVGLFLYTVSYTMSTGDESFIRINSVNKMRPLNILFVVGHFPVASQIFILNIMTGLIDKGHNVFIFSLNKDDYKNVHPHIEKYKLMDRVFYEQFPMHLSECDIVFCQFGYLGKKIVETKKLVRWLNKRKIVVCFRGHDITSYTQKNQHIYDDLFAKADLFLPVCDYFKNRLISLGCNSKKIVVHHSAIDCAQFFLKQGNCQRILLSIVFRCVGLSKKKELILH